MKKEIFLTLKTLAVILLFIALMVITGSFVTPLFGIDLSNVKVPPQNKFIPGLISVAIIQSMVLILIAKRSHLKGIKLSLLIATVYFTINHLLNVIESLIFLRYIYPVSHQLVDTFNGLLSAVILGLVIAFLFGNDNEGPDRKIHFNWSVRIILPWMGWILLWFVIYITAGMLIPTVVDGFNEYYFGENGAMDMSLVPIGYAMQIPRASMWILLTIYLMQSLKGTWLEKRLIIAIAFGAIMSSVLLLPNHIMPDIIRLAHLPEILFANMLWGFLISWKVQKRFTE